MSTFADRLLGAAKLDAATFEEVEADANATAQAMAVVVLSSVAGGIGAPGVMGLGIGSLVSGTLAAIIGWIAWAALTYILGTRVFAEPHTRADLGELLRTIGFASAPGILRVAGILPGLGWLVWLATSVWMLAAMVVAVRQALDYTSTGRALMVCIAGWVLSLIVAAIIGLLFAPVVAVF